jgi:hypothetical protein
MDRVIWVEMGGGSPSRSNSMCDFSLWPNTDICSSVGSSRSRASYWFDVLVETWWWALTVFFFSSPSFFFLSFSWDSCWLVKIERSHDILLVYQVWTSFFYCYLFYFEFFFWLIFFSILSPSIWFHLIFISSLVFIFFISICLFLSFS